MAATDQNVGRPHRPCYGATGRFQEADDIGDNGGPNKGGPPSGGPPISALKKDLANDTEEELGYVQVISVCRPPVRGWPLVPPAYRIASLPCLGRDDDPSFRTCVDLPQDAIDNPFTLIERVIRRLDQSLASSA